LLTEKIDVKGEKQHEVYQWLTQKALNGVSDADVKWNFNKFLVDEKGRWLAYFPSSVNPLSNKIIGKL
jgi:glutathione peroxidase